MSRIGLLVPSTNVSTEADFQRVLRPGTSVHSYRLWVPPIDIGDEMLDRMNEDIGAGVKSLASAEVDVVAYACTSGSFYKGRGWDEQLVASVSGEANIPAISTSLAVVGALRELGAKRISVTTPYPAWTNDRLKLYFEAFGFKVLNVDGDRSASTESWRAVNDQDPDEIRDFTMSHIREEADAIFCACTAWRSMEAAEAIELATAKPVVTANQATIWAAFRQAGRRINATGFRRLLSSH